MKKKKRKLRLRKQVIFALPIVLISCIFTVVLLTHSLTSKDDAEVVREEFQASFEVEDGINISDTELYKRYVEFIDQRQKDNTIIYYAKEFNLNIPKVLEIAHKLTNNYQNKQYQKDFIIAPKKMKSQIGAFDSFEAGVVYFVRNIYSYPEKYGSSIKELRLDEKPNTKKVKVKGHYYLDNGLTFEQYLGKLCDLYNIPKSLALAIVYEETGVMKSNLFLNSNNIGGQRGVAGWMTFPTLEAGTMSFVINLRNMIKKYNLDLTKEENIYTLSSIYVYGNTKKISKPWSEKVIYFKGKIEEKDLFTIAK